MGHQRGCSTNGIEKSMSIFTRITGPRIHATGMQDTTMCLYEGINTAGLSGLRDIAQHLDICAAVKLHSTAIIMVHISTLLTALSAASGATAGLIQARRALEERQSSNYPLNSVQNWSNDFATLNFKTGANGLFSVDWNNRPGGNFVVGRGYQPARDM